MSGARSVVPARRERDAGVAAATAGWASAVGTWPLAGFGEIALDGAKHG